jgi:hypothetical protein
MADAPFQDDTEVPDRDRGYDEALVAAIRSAIAAAITDSEGDRKNRRMLAMQAFRGDPYGDESIGRSSIVMTDFRDTVKAIMPSLLRVFWGSERAMEYVARTPEDVPLSEQVTDFINDVVLQIDNEGFLIFKGWFTDALTQWIGVVKVWWEEDTCTRTRRYTLPVTEQDGEPVSDEEQQALDAVFLASKYPDATELPEHTRQGNTLIVTEEYTEGKARFDVLPPESFIFSPDARSAESAPFIGDVTFKTKSELLSMGIPAENLPDDLFTMDMQGTIMDEMEERVRNPLSSSLNTPAVEVPQARTTRYVEGYMLLPVEYEDRASHMQWHKVCTAGEACTLVADIEPVDWHPYCVLSPDPMPHRIEGMCPADDTMDIQRTRTLVTRATMDSLAEAVVPRRGVVEDMVTMSDVLTNKRGHPIRMKAPGMVQDLSIPFVGGQALPVLEYFDAIRENRTGITKATAGLNADALQSSTKSAVDATVTAGQQQLELIARCFAETGVKMLFRKLLRLVCERQSEARVVRLRNKQFVTVDAAQWDANMDIGVSVALGSGLTESRIQTLMMVAAKQEQILQLLGPSNPLVSLGQYRNTLAKLVELAGMKDASLFFLDVPDDFQPPAPAEPPPDPAMILAQIEREKMQEKARLDREQMQFDMQMEREKMQFDREQALREDDRLRDEAESKLVLAIKEMELKYQAQVSRDELMARTKLVQAAQSDSARDE